MNKPLFKEGDELEWTGKVEGRQCQREREEFFNTTTMPLIVDRANQYGKGTIIYFFKTHEGRLFNYGAYEEELHLANDGTTLEDWV
jgi:hypothetical protein